MNSAALQLRFALHGHFCTHRRDPGCKPRGVQALYKPLAVRSSSGKGATVLCLCGARRAGALTQLGARRNLNGNRQWKKMHWYMKYKRIFSKAVASPNQQPSPVLVVLVRVLVYTELFQMDQTLTVPPCQCIPRWREQASPSITPTRRGRGPLASHRTPTSRPPQFPYRMRPTNHYSQP